MTNHVYHDAPYLELLQRVLKQGSPREDRTGVGTTGLFAQSLRFDLRQAFPMLTTKQMSMRVVASELAWMLSGSTHVQDLHPTKVRIWDEWANDDGYLGPVYGHQWRSWGNKVDQLEDLVHALRTNPDSRRHVVTAWNPSEVPDCGLPPCHVLFQCYSIVNRDLAGLASAHPDHLPRELSLSMTQRSADLFLGVPYNIAFYALLTHVLATLTGHQVGELHILLNDAHIYRNHEDQVREQLSREYRPSPTLVLRPTTLHELHDFWEPVLEPTFNLRNLVRLEGYKPHEPIKAEVAV